jgi:hypothetical protein
MFEFPCTAPVNTEVRLFDGHLEVTADERNTATVTVEPFDNSDSAKEAASRTTVEMRGSKLVVHAPEVSSGWLRRRGAPVRITIGVPANSSVDAKIASADTFLHGDYSTVTINVASGDIMLDRASGDVSINSASGDLRVGRVGGGLKVNTASGDVIADEVVGLTTAHSASGDIEIDRAGDGVRANTASGDIKVREARQGAYKVNSASGDIAIGVANGVGVWMDVTTMSGRAQSDLNNVSTGPNGQAVLSLHLRSMSGDIRVLRA